MKSRHEHGRGIRRYAAAALFTLATPETNPCDASGAATEEEGP